MIPLFHHSRFNQYIEIFSWILLLSSFLIVNFLPSPIFMENRTVIHFILALTGSQLLIFYRLIPTKVQNKSLVSFVFQGLFLTYIMLGLHFTGFLSSYFFVFLFIPILVSAFTLTPLLLLVLVFYTCALLFFDAYLFYPDYFLDLDLLLLLGQRVGSVIVVGLLSFLIDYEVHKRELEVMTTQSERDYAKSLASEMNFLNKQSRAILDSISEAVLGLNKEGKIIFYNSYAEKLLGWKELEVSQKMYTDYLLVYPSGVSYVVNNLKLPFEKDLKLFNKNGGGISVKVINSPIVGDNHTFLGNVLTIRDISREKELEEMKFDFVSMAAHELRSPVTIIRGYLTAIDEEIKTKDVKIQKFIRRALVTTDSLRVLVENLLNISQIEKGSLKITQEEVVWEDVVSKIVDDFGPRGEEKNISLTFQKSKKKLPKVYVDVFRISEVLANLLSNAINYTDGGGKILVKCSVKNNFVVTSISDTGIGIAEKSIPYLFQKFYRVKENMEATRGGTGLGLYISKTIVLRHGGRIWVDSKIGDGSTFYFSVPVASS